MTNETFYICDNYNPPTINFMGVEYLVEDYEITRDYPFMDEIGSKYRPQRNHTVTLTAVSLGKTLGRFTNGYAHAIRKVIFSNPATIIYWADGTKTVVKCQEGCTYSKYAGFMACVTKKVFGNKGNFNNVVNYWLENGEDHSNDSASE